MRGVLLALVLSAPAARAEPLVAWSYATAFAGDRGHATVLAGNGRRPDNLEPDGYRYYTSYATLAALPPAGPQAGSGAVGVGTAGQFTNFLWDADPRGGVPLADLDRGFVASLTITDELSGASGRFAAAGRVTISGDGWAVSEPRLELSPAGPAEQTLGGQRYRVSWREDLVSVDEYGTREARLVADVGVAPAVPEPATWALAGLGLAAVAGRRRVRLAVAGG